MGGQRQSEGRTSFILSLSISPGEEEEGTDGSLYQVLTPQRRNYFYQRVRGQRSDPEYGSRETEKSWNKNSLTLIELA